MSYDFDRFCLDCRETLVTMPHEEGLRKLAGLLQHLLKDDEFVAERLGPDAVPGRPVIYEDRDTGFCIQLHIHQRSSGTPPHDHGSSWAVYGQVVGCTDMTTYRRLDDGRSAGHAKIEIVREFRMDPGDVGFFDTGEIHSIKVYPGGRVIRVTGTNLDEIPHNLYDLEKNEVRTGSPVR